jgi:integrase
MVQELVQTGNNYVYLRRKTYYFRVVIPPHLRKLCPSLPLEIKRSLRTDSLTDALAMVGDKLPLIRLLRSCTSADLILKLYQKLSDFSNEIAGWVGSKLSVAEPAREHSFTALESTKSKPKCIKLDKAWSDFSEWKSWSDKQAKANQRMYDNLRLFLGDVHVDEITKRHLKDALKGISELPQRNKKNYKQLPLEKLKGVEIPDEDRVSSKYVKEHLKLCQSLFNRYLNQELEVLKVSPTEGVKWEYENKRFGSLTDAEVKQTLLIMEDKPEWFEWFVLIAIYSGARRSEIAGLTKDDIKLCSDTNRYYFIVREGKTKAARRAVPIHKALIDSGLLSWVDLREGRVFDAAYRNPNRVTDLFGSLMERKVNDYGERLVFHSLRHTFITKARAAGISDVLVQQVVGHEKRGAGQTDRYTHTFQLKDVLKVVDSVTYE